jgi:hypothetical protein
MLGTIQKGHGPGLIMWYDLSNGKGTRDLVHEMLGAHIGQVALQQ